MQRDMCHMPPQSLLCVLVALAFSGCNVAQRVTQVQPTGSSQWGEEVTLDCSYETSEYFYRIFWYRQLFSGEMVFLIYQPSFDTQNQRSGRYSVVFQKSFKSISLVISASQPEDSGTYFCALSELAGGIRALLSTDKLVFGQGTQVTVEPKSQPPAKPSVFIMKNGTNVACLVKDFYPKEVTISLRSSKKIVEFDPAIVISPSGKYSAVKLGQYGDSNSVTCSVQHNSETVHSTDFEPYANSFNNEKLPEPENDTQISEPCYGPRVTVHTEKVNMMSLTVLGLRLLFAKTIAINFLLTVKLFF